MVTIASTTSSQEEIEHAVGPDWRDPAALKTSEVPKSETEESTVETAEQEAAKETESETQISKAKTGTPKWVQKRIDKLTARAKEAESRIQGAIPKEEFERAVAQKVEELQKGQQTPSLDENDPLVQQIVAKSVAAALEKVESERRQQEFTERLAPKLPKEVSWDEFYSLAKEINVPSAVMDVWNQLPTEIGDKMFIHLVEYPEIAKNLLKIAPDGANQAQIAMAVFEFSKIAQSLERTDRSPEKKEKAKPKPPEPIATVGASSARSNVPLDQLDPKEYIKVMNKRERERRF